MKIGVQLYNFREALAVDFTGTLRRIAELGFDGVEFAGSFGGLAPSEIASCMEDLGLECAGMMSGIETFADPASDFYDYARALRTPAVTASLMVDFVKDYPIVLQQIRAAGKGAALNHFLFTYHNHWAELARGADGTPVLDRLLAETDPAQVGAEPDVCWLTRGMVDPAAFLRRHAGRFCQIHLKDIQVPDELETTTELGKGVVALRPCLEAAAECGCEWYIYEQDFCRDSMESARESLAWLKEHL